MHSFFHKLPVPQMHSSRRRFIRNTLFVSGVVLIPMQACRRIFKITDPPEYFLFNTSDRKLLEAVFSHLFPDDGNGPGLDQIRPVDYLEWVLNDPKLERRSSELLKKGTGWLRQA